MDRFIGPEETRKQHKQRDPKESSNLYELRGVLVHKGTSAYHGHYEAQVFDVQCVLFPLVSAWPDSVEGPGRGIDSTTR